MATLAPSVQQTGTGLPRWLALAHWNVSRALIVTRREVLDMFRDWRIVAPTIVLTVIFPYIANWGAGRMLSFVERFGASLIGDRLIPFLLMVVGFFPISFSLIIALETFVGEKERRSLEPLLATPLTNTQLYIGKTLSSTIPPLMGSLLGVTVYLVGVYRNLEWVPSATLLLQIILLNLIQALVMVAAAVVVSSQTTSVRAANLLASFIIIPMAFLIQAEALIMFWANYTVLWLIIVGLVVVMILLVRMGIRIFNREELIGGEIDELNLLGALRQWLALTLARHGEGPRRSAWQWYRQEVLAVVGRMWSAMGVLSLAMVVAYFIGLRYADVYRIPTELFRTEDWFARFQLTMEQAGLTNLRGVLWVLSQNTRVLAVASLLAVFSFGVLAIMLLMVPLGLVGYLNAHILIAGMDPMLAWAALFPHGMIEIPAALLAGAAAVRLGATVISPPPGKTVGEAWMEALADATRLWFAAVLPLLLVAAVAEIYVTPWLVGLVAGGR